MTGPPSKKAPGSNHGALLITQSKYTEKPDRSQYKIIDRSKLPGPILVLEQLGIRYIQRPAWLAVYCPFHAGGKERNPSLSMNATDGHYKCHACGAKGPDVIAFYRAVTKQSFFETIKSLGVQ